MSHDRRAEDCRVTAGAWPAGVALARFAGGRARGAAAAPWVPVVAAVTLSEFLLTELFGLMEAHYQLFRSKGHAVHRIHSSRGYREGRYQRQSE